MAYDDTMSSGSVLDYEEYNALIVDVKSDWSDLSTHIADLTAHGNFAVSGPKYTWTYQSMKDSGLKWYGAYKHSANASIHANTSGSVHKLWLWSANKSWYANSSNVKTRFKSSSNIWVFASSQKISSNSIKTSKIYAAKNGLYVYSGTSDEKILNIRREAEENKIIGGSIGGTYPPLRIVSADGAPYPYIILENEGTPSLSYINLAIGDASDFKFREPDTNTVMISSSKSCLKLDPTAYVKIDGALSSQNISGSLLALHKSRDINSWDSDKWKNSGLVWDNSLRKWKAKTSSSSTITNFLSLTDTPDSYSGKTGKTPIVNVAENALIFAEIVCNDNQIVFNNNSVVWA